MAHHHHHHDESDVYWVDQLCMVALGGAFGAICLSLFFWQRPMLNLILGTQFHLMVAISGGVLLVLALIRAATLWGESAKQPAKAHVHEPHHDHGHDHHHAPGETCDHIQAAGHAHAHHHHHHEHAHAPGEACDHGHDCGHDHNHDDHEHGWAPWRYVVLLVPVILFLLGLPNKGPSAGGFKAEIDVAAESAKQATHDATVIVADPWTRLGLVAGLLDSGEEGEAVNFKRLQESVGDADERGYFAAKTVKLRGQFTSNPSDARYFEIVRFKMQCCAGDAVALRLVGVAKEPVAGPKLNDWVEVVGRVEYRKRGPGHTLRLTSASVKPSNPDPNPYVQ